MANESKAIHCPWCTSERWISVTVEGRVMAQCVLCGAIHHDLGEAQDPAEVAEFRSKLEDLKAKLGLADSPETLAKALAAAERMRPASGMPRPPAEEARERSAADIGSTGVPGPHARPEAGHWLKFNDARQITGCQCGFAADTDSDCGWGDSVVTHLLEVGAENAETDVDGWTLHSRPGGMMLSHDTDADMPTLWSDGPMQLGAVLAFIADQEDPDA